MAYGDLKTLRFKNHYPTSSPSAAQLMTHYKYLNQAYIRNQTAYRTANWFLAELDSAPTYGGDKGELYVIYNPTNDAGNAITSATVATAKICGAPNPPFNGEDQPD